MNRAATSLDAHPDSTAPTASAPDEEAWLHDPDERKRWIRAAEDENARLYKLAVDFSAMWTAEIAGHNAPAFTPGKITVESADMLAELARRCRVIGNLDPPAVEAFVAVAEACGVSRERLRASFRELVSEDVA